jgi:hypothetical protein
VKSGRGTEKKKRKAEGENQTREEMGPFNVEIFRLRRVHRSWLFILRSVARYGAIRRSEGKSLPKSSAFRVSSP